VTLADHKLDTSLPVRMHMPAWMANHSICTLHRWQWSPAPMEYRDGFGGFSCPLTEGWPTHLYEVTTEHFPE